MNDYLKKGNRLGLFLAILFVLCFAWNWINPVEQELHTSFLRLVFFGYDGANLGSFVFGLIQSYVWGYVFVGLWHLVGTCCCTSCCKK